MSIQATGTEARFIISRRKQHKLFLLVLQQSVWLESQVTVTFLLCVSLFGGGSGKISYRSLSEAVSNFPNSLDEIILSAQPDRLRLRNYIEDADGKERKWGFMGRKFILPTN